MHIKPFQATYPKLEYITSPESFLGTVKEEYPEYVQSGFFKKTEEACIYLYRIHEFGHIYTGVIACAGVEDYLEGSIKKHENTLPEKEQRQLHLLLLREAVVKPVLLTYPPVPKIDDLIQKTINTQSPFIDIELEVENQRHQIWEVSEPDQIQQLQQHFEQHVPYTYIADGHHRTSIMALMHKRKPSGRFKQFLCAFFPTTELDILDYNRLIDGMNDLSVASFIARLSKVAEIEVLDEPRKPTHKFELVMNFQREWFALHWRPSVLEEMGQGQEVLLDVYLLNELILKDILGLTDIRNNTRIRYIEGSKGLEGMQEKVAKSDERIGFLLFPVSMEDFIHISDTDNILPPKSTWFEPRMRNGLIVQGI